MSPRPNILFLVSDAHRADVTGFESNLVVRTPVLDEPANSDGVFKKSYAPFPFASQVAYV